MYLANFYRASFQISIGIGNTKSFSEDSKITKMPFLKLFLENIFCFLFNVFLIYRSKDKGKLTS